MHGKVILVLALLLTIQSARASEARVAVGMGMETRLQSDVNPDYTSLKNMPSEYVKLLLWPWALTLELGQEGRDSSSGSLAVQTRSTSAALWGRYEFKEPGLWSPFVGVGAGSFFDVVSTHFETSQDTRYGRRGFAGLGAGITSTLWKNLLVEGEGRMALVQDNSSPVFSALLRVGWAL